MNNEEYVKLIREGHNKLILELWQRVERLLYKMGAAFYLRSKSRCDKAGIVLDDIKQECFFVFLDALEAYKEDQEYLFTTYLSYPFLNHMNQLTGQRTEAQKNMPLNNAVSLDTPVMQESDTPGTIEDLIIDTEALSPIDSAIQEETKWALNNALSGLPKDMERVISYRYMTGHTKTTLDKVAAILGLSRDRARKYEALGLKRLRNNRELRLLYLG